jgi:hypothetical protein
MNRPMNIGNRASAMRLQCKRCGWPPPESMSMLDARLHFQVDHDTDKIEFELAAMCTCNEAMVVTHSRASGGGVKDFLTCGVCGSTGFLHRRATS